MHDSELIRQIKDGNIELYSDLMRRYQRKIMSFILHMLRSTKMELVAEDLCSETFYKAYRSLHSFREVDAQFSTWLYTIARNTVLSELRKQRSIHIPLEESGMMPAAPEEAAPEQQVLLGERMTLVREAIRSLPEKQRSALVLREYEGLDYQEIADILGGSVSSVKSLLFRARSSVKVQLEPYFEEVRSEDFEGMKLR